MNHHDLHPYDEKRRDEATRATRKHGEHVRSHAPAMLSSAGHEPRDDGDGGLVCAHCGARGFVFVQAHEPGARLVGDIWLVDCER